MRETTLKQQTLQMNVFARCVIVQIQMKCDYTLGQMKAKDTFVILLTKFIS